MSRSARNGLGIAALVLGIVGAALGALPLVWSCSILAIVFGAIGTKRADRGEATNGTMARWGLWLGIVGLAVWAGLWVIGGVIAVLTHVG